MSMLSEKLSGLLADYHVLYVKLRHYHWNVEGTRFKPLHELFEEFYTELEGTIDELAEHIRTYGVYAPGTMKAFLQLSSLQEDESVPEALAMAGNLATDYEAVIQAAHHIIDEAEKAHEHATADLLTGFTGAHKKAIWMLKSHLK